MSLRTFHLLFIFLAILGADLFGIWGVWRYFEDGDVAALVGGCVTLLGGVGLVFYAVRFVRRMDAEGIR